MNSKAKLTLTLIISLFLVSCVSAPEVTDPNPTITVLPTSTATPLSPSSTPQPTTARLWASPSLPISLLETASLITQLGDLEVEWVDDREQAQVQLEPNPERPITRWIYAIVAPFPTVRDGYSLEELRRAWNGASEASPVYVSDQIRSEMAPLLGIDSGARLVPNEELLDSAWAARNAFSIVAFDELEPRWKVMQLNGISPLDWEFDPLSYPLSVSYGLSGDPEVMNLLAPMLKWPETNRDPGKLSSVLMTGVSALVRATAWRMDLNGTDYPGELIKEVFQRADISHVSHESAFGEDCPPPDPVQKSLRFCSSPRHLPLFESLGVDLIELSGNHLADWGISALLYTLDLYDERGFETFAGGRDLAEARQPVLIEHNGNRLAFIGCNAAGPAFGWAKEDRPGALSCNEEGLLETVRQLADEGNAVIFTFQWPESDSPRPLPNQMEAFQEAVDAGAIIVNGSQAHRPQSIEFYSDGFIHYGLGNLFFDQMHALPLRQEFLDRHTFYDGRHISTELITAMLEDYSQPRPTTEFERQTLLEDIFEVSGW